MSINPEPGKDRGMRADDWQFSERAALKKMGLEGQPYIAIEHEKFGKDGVLRRHRHLVASRTDLDHMRAIRADHNYRKHEELARELERHLGHDRVQGAHAEREGAERPERTPSYAEMQQAKRGAVSRNEAKTLITQLWHTTDTAGALKAALEDQGWMLARGDKTTAQGRAYLMVIDPQGGLHEVARRVADVKPAAVHERMAAIDAASLPSVDEARAAQKVRAAERQAEQHREENSIEKAPPMSDSPDAQPANQNERDQAPFVAAWDSLNPSDQAPLEIIENEFPKASFDATEPDAKLREAWRQPAWSAATIEIDPWTAVYLPIPRDADPQLLMRGIEATFDCKAIIMDGPGTGPRLPQLDYGPEDNGNHAAERFRELSHQLGVALEPELAADAAALSRRTAWQQPTLTAQTIDADPWTAVELPIPEKADAVLLLKAAFAAMYCYNQPQHPDATPEQAHRHEAGERVKELAKRIHTTPSPDLYGDKAWQEWAEDLAVISDYAAQVRAWEAPAFSFDTMQAEVWTAVYLPIPADCDPRLLEEAYTWAIDLQQYAGRGGALTEPFATLPNDVPDPATAATARIAELESRLAPARAKEAEQTPIFLTIWAAWRRPEFSFETMSADPWTAVYLPIPEEANLALLDAAFSAASLCIEAIDSGASGPCVRQGDDGPAENRARAQARMAELEFLLDRANENTPEHIALVTDQEPHQAQEAFPVPSSPAAALIPPDGRETPASDTGLRPADHIVSRIFSGIADAVETVLGGFLDFLAGGGIKRTAQQMRDQVAAETNLETVHARAFEADERQAEQHHEMLAEQQRTRDIARTLQIEPVSDPEENRFRRIMQRAARDQERERDDYDRER